MIVPQWETIIQNSSFDITERLKVPGGWLVCRTNGIHSPRSLASWFVNDPQYQWKIKQESDHDSNQ